MAELTIITGEEVTAHNVEEALNIDLSEYPSEYHLTPNTCLAYLKKNHYIYIMLKDGAEVVGYINFSPVTESTYEAMRSGEMVDVAINADDLLAYEKGGYYDAYLSSILLKKEYRGNRYSILMLNKLAELICDLAEKGIFIRRIVADVISEIGAIVCSKFGLKKIIGSNHSSNIYEMRLVPPEFEVTELNKRIFLAYTKEEA